MYPTCTHWAHWDYSLSVTTMCSACVQWVNDPLSPVTVGSFQSEDPSEVAPVSCACFLVYPAFIPLGFTHPNTELNRPCGAAGFLLAELAAFLAYLELFGGAGSEPPELFRHPLAVLCAISRVAQ